MSLPVPPPVPPPVPQPGASIVPSAPASPAPPPKPPRRKPKAPPADRVLEPTVYTPPTIKRYKDGRRTLLIRGFSYWGPMVGWLPYLGRSAAAADKTLKKVAGGRKIAAALQRGYPIDYRAVYVLHDWTVMDATTEQIIYWNGRQLQYPFGPTSLASARAARGKGIEVELSCTGPIPETD